MTLVERHPRWGPFVLLAALVLVGAAVVFLPGGSVGDDGAPGTTVPTGPIADGPDGPEERPVGTATIAPGAGPAGASHPPAVRGRRTGPASRTLQGERVAVAAGDSLWVLDAASGERTSYRLPGDGVSAVVGRRSGIVVLVGGRAYVVRDPARYPVVPPARLGWEQADVVLPGVGADEVWLARADAGALALTRADVASRRVGRPVLVTFDGAAPTPLAATGAGLLVTPGDHEDRRIAVVDPLTGEVRRVLDDAGWFVAAGSATLAGLEPAPSGPGHVLVLTDLFDGGSRRVPPDARVTDYQHRAAVSPDGGRLAVAVSVADSELGRDREGFALVDLGQGVLRSVAAHPGWGADPVWSVDGRLVHGLHPLPLDHGRLAATSWTAVGSFRAISLPVEVRSTGIPVHLAALWPPDLDR